MSFLKQLILLTASMLILLAASGISIAADGGFGGGGGSLEDPFLIEDAADFKAIQKNLSAHYKLVNNIDLSGSDLKPIGNETNPFKGSLTGGSDGNALYEISNFKCIVDTGLDPTGLFGWVDNARFSNLVLRNFLIEDNNRKPGGFLAGVINNSTEVVDCTVIDSKLSGSSHLGLIGYADNSMISDCLSKHILIEGAGRIGGILGRGCNTKIINCHSDGSLVGKQEVGGVVGSLGDGSIDGSSSSCTIRVISEPETSPAYPLDIGGLAGYVNSTSVADSFAKGDIKGGIDGICNNTGGLVGRSYSCNFKNCYATGDVISAKDSNNVGGLIGISNNSIILGCSAEGAVKGTKHVGGLLGSSTYNKISESSAEGAVEGINSVGGLTGFSVASTILESSANGTVKGTGDYVGGLLGYSFMEAISQCSVLKDANAEGINFVGGLAGGVFYSEIEDCSVVSAAAVKGRDSIGGLVGHLYQGDISRCSVTGDTKVTGLSNVGGLVGFSDAGEITGSYVAENSIVIGDSDVGGLVGRLVNSTLSRSFMAGDISGNNNVGGLAGSMNINASYAVSDCYVTGDVLGTGSSVGGLVGDFYKGEIKNSLALNEFVTGSSDIGRIYGLKTDGTLSDTYAWINMSDGSDHFKDGETNVTSVDVWRKYPSSGWETSGFGGEWELNTYGDFLLPVHAWTDKNVAADAAHLIPKYFITYDGNGNTSGAVPVDGTAYLDRFAPAAAIISDAGSMEKSNSGFNGWNTAADGSGTAYAAGVSLLMDSNMTLYAQWTEVPSTSGGGPGTGSATVTGPVTNMGSSEQGQPPVQPGYETPVEPEPISEIIVILFFMIAIVCYLFVMRVEIEKESG